MPKAWAADLRVGANAQCSSDFGGHRLSTGWKETGSPEIDGTPLLTPQEELIVPLIETHCQATCAVEPFPLGQELVPWQFWAGAPEVQDNLSPKIEQLTWNLIFFDICGMFWCI